MFGSGNYLIDLEANQKELREFITKFQNQFENILLTYETLMIYDEIKYVFSPKLK